MKLLKIIIKKSLILGASILILIIIFYILNRFLGKEMFFTSKKCQMPKPVFNSKTKKCEACKGSTPVWNGTVCVKTAPVAVKKAAPAAVAAKKAAPAPECPEYHYYDEIKKDCLFGDKKCDEMMETNYNTDYIYDPKTTECVEINEKNVTTLCQKRCPQQQVMRYQLLLNNKENIDVCEQKKDDFKSKFSCKSME